MLTEPEHDPPWSDPLSRGFPLHMLLYVPEIRHTTSYPFGVVTPRDHAGSRTVDSRIVESAKEILLRYYLLIYTGRTQGYIRTLIHVSSLVLRLQSYIVTCVYLLDYWWLSYLIITWQHSRIDQYPGIDLFGALSGTVPRYLKRTQSAVRPVRQQYGWEHRSLTLETWAV
jgi:hypothetical protein